MTEEVKIDEVVAETFEEAVQEPVKEVIKEAPKLSSLEQKAVGMGWKPKEQFEGDPEEWRPAKEFIDRGELLDKIHELNRDKKETKEALALLVEHNKKTEEAAYKRAMEELKRQQLQAAEAGDTNTVAAVTDKLLELNRQPPVAVAPVGVKQFDENAVKEFIGKNSDWYNRNSDENIEMSVYATNLDNQLTSRYPDKSTKEILVMVEDSVKKVFSHRFKKEYVEHSPVSAPGHADVKSKEVGFNDLPADQKPIVKHLQRTLGDKFSLKNYIKDLKTQGLM